MQNNRNKKLTSQAHVASLVDVKPTTKANNATLQSNLKKGTTKATRGREAIPPPEISIVLSDGTREFHTHAIHLKDNLYELKKEFLSKDSIEYFTNTNYNAKFDQFNKGITRLANDNAMLRERLVNEELPLKLSVNDNKNIALKSAKEGIENLYRYDFGFTIYKDAITSCLFLMAEHAENENLGALHYLWRFFNDLQKDITED